MKQLKEAMKTMSFHKIVSFSIALLLCTVAETTFNFCAAAPSVDTASGKANNRNYINSHPTPMSARQHLDLSASRAKYVVLYGGGDFWASATGLKAYPKTYDGFRKYPQATAIVIRDRKFIRRIPNILHYRKRSLLFPQAYQARNEVSIEFRSTSPYDNFGADPDWDDAKFAHYAGKGYIYRRYVGYLEALPEDAPRIKAFIREMAKLARAHHPGVSFLRYDIQSLSPS